MIRIVWLPICCMILGTATFPAAGRDNGFSPFDMMYKPMDMFDASDRRRERRERRHRRPPPPPDFGYAGPPPFPAPPGFYAPQYPTYPQAAQPARNTFSATTPTAPSQPDKKQGPVSEEQKSTTPDPAPVVKQTLPQGRYAQPSGYSFRPMSAGSEPETTSPQQTTAPVETASVRENPGPQSSAQPSEPSQKLPSSISETEQPIMYKGRPAIFRPREAGLTPM